MNQTNSKLTDPPVPRGWGNIEKQRDPVQQADYAKPDATDSRFKAAAFLLFCSWCVCIASLRHSIHHYKPRNRSFANRMFGGIQFLPFKYILILFFSLVLIGYEAASAFVFDIAFLNLDAHPGWIFGLGWAPIACIFVVLITAGYLDDNEDRVLIAQRRIREHEIDQELGITKKPHWWRRLHDNHDVSVHEQIRRNVIEVGGGAATTRHLHQNIEMGNMPSSKKVQRQEHPDVIAAARLLFPEASNVSEKSDPFSDAPTAAERGRSDTSSTLGGMSERSGSQESTGSLGRQPQQVRSMLDI